MPIDLSKYPPNWKQIALEVKNKADWICQGCGKPCRKPGVSWEEFKMCLPIEWQHQIDKPQRFTLTVAHLNHTPMDCSELNLKALCSVCHLKYDAKLHAQNARKSRASKIK